VVIQTTKTGQIFVLDRLTGAPVAEVREQAVPQGAAPGDRLSSTQPISVGMPQLGAEYLRESDMWGLTPFDQLYCRIAFRGLRYAGRFTPPRLDRSLDFPGPYGGINWGSGAVDPANHLLIVSDVRQAYHSRLLPRRLAPAAQTGPHRKFQAMLGTPFAYRRGQFNSPLYLPCHKPPFGRITAIDLRSGRIAWQIPAGTLRNSGPARLRVGLPIPLGTQTVGGTMVTAGGLVFHAGARDQYLRAYDVATGEELWRAQLPVGTEATPMTYRSPRSGRQYVVISAGGIGASPDRGGYVIAFALPES
jgi:quinate dehydrogenase (quinone)